MLLLAACGRSAPAPDNTAAAAFVPPPTQAPEPLPGQEHNRPITAYVGHYPADAVDGVGFYDRTEIANALIEAVPDEKVRRLMTGRDATSVPVFQTADGRIAAHGCEAHNCGDRNWTFMVAADGTHGEGCYHDADAMGATSLWYAGTAIAKTRPGACPQE